MEGFTHLAELYGFRCWFNEDTNEVKGTNWFNDFMIDTCVWLESRFEFNYGFHIKLIERIN